MQTRTDQLKSMPVDADTPLHHHVSVFPAESETTRTERQSDVQIHRSNDISDKLYFLRSDNCVIMSTSSRENAFNWVSR